MDPEPLPIAGDFQACADRMTELAEPTRLQLLMQLCSGPKAVGALAKSTGLKLVSASYHLGRLKYAGIVECSKSGRTVTYRLADGTVELHDDKLRINLGCCQFEIATDDQR